MPVYEYECEKCGHAFERSHPMSEPPVRDCPVEGCGGRVRRLISPGTGVIFKGSGFYATDYKRSGAAAEPKACPAAASKACPNSGSCPAASAGK